MILRWKKAWDRAMVELRVLWEVLVRYWSGNSYNFSSREKMGKGIETRQSTRGLGFAGK